MHREEEDNQGQIECKHADSTNKKAEKERVYAGGARERENRNKNECMEIVFLPQTKNSIASIEVYTTQCCIRIMYEDGIKGMEKSVTVKHHQQQQWNNSKNE